MFTHLTLILQANRKSADLPSESQKYFELAQMCYFKLQVIYLQLDKQLLVTTVSVTLL